MTGVIPFSESHRQRLENCLAGKEMNVSPVALWRHFPVDDQSPDRLAAAIINYQNTFDFDLIKVTPASSFCLRDWGVEDTWKGDSEGTRAYSPPIIQRSEDWSKLRRLDPRKGKLRGQLEALELILKEFAPRTPVMQTIFDPMSQAKNLAGQTGLLRMMRQSPDALHHALQIITKSTIDFISACTALKIDGIFLAIQHAQSSLLSPDEFEQFCAPYDLEILASVKSLWLNMIHIHGEGIYFEKVAPFPAQIFNWHDRHTFPDIQESRKIYQGVICGGLSRIESLELGNPEMIRAEAQDALQASKGKKFILGTGCVVPITAPYGNILAARNSVISA